MYRLNSWLNSESMVQPVFIPGSQEWVKQVSSLQPGSRAGFSICFVNLGPPLELNTSPNKLYIFIITSGKIISMEIFLSLKQAMKLVIFSTSGYSDGPSAMQSLEKSNGHKGAQIRNCSLNILHWNDDFWCLSIRWCVELYMNIALTLTICSDAEANIQLNFMYIALYSYNTRLSQNSFKNVPGLRFPQSKPRVTVARKQFLPSLTGRNLEQNQAAEGEPICFWPGSGCCSWATPSGRSPEQRGGEQKQDND